MSLIQSRDWPIAKYYHQFMSKREPYRPIAINGQKEISIQHLCTYTVQILYVRAYVAIYILVEQDLYSLCAHYAYNNYCLQSTVGAGLAGVEELKAHPFFASVDWNSV